VSESASPRSLPALIGPYRILKLLGEGGTALVYLAEQIRPFRRIVALKVLRTHLLSEDAVFRFEQELQTLARLQHENIAQVFDCSARGRQSPYFTMEHVEGASIAGYCDEHRLAVHERVRLFLQVCDAVQYIHQNGVIHRDLGASNILVQERDGTPSVKLIDFGIAKLTREHRNSLVPRTDEDRILGTFGYMSPEQAGEGLVDTRADVYSLGAVLYELLTGAVPVEGPKGIEEIPEFLRRLREDVPELASHRVRRFGEESLEVARRRATTPAALSRELRNDLDWIVRHALEKRPLARYATAADLARDLRAYLRGDAVSVGPQSPLYHLRQGVRRNVKYVAAALLTLVLLGSVIALSAFWHLRLGAEHERHIAVLRLGEAIQVNVANAHLWLEEAMAGDGDVDLARDVYGPIDEASGLVRDALERGRADEGYAEAEGPALAAVLQDLRTALDEFGTIARARWVRRLDEGNSGSPLDRQCDALYQDVLRLSSSLSLAASRRPLDEQQRISRTVLIVNALAVLISVALLLAIARSWAAPSKRGAGERGD